MTTTAAILNGSDTAAEAARLRAEADGIERRAAKCGRCQGKGEISCFRHVEGGVCFGCDGTGTGVPTRAQVKEIQALHATADFLDSIAAPLVAREAAAWEANAAAAGAEDFHAALIANVTAPHNPYGV